MSRSDENLRFTAECLKNGTNRYSFSSPHGGYEYPLLLLFVYAAIFFRGAGRCSIDRMIGKEF